MTLRGRRVLVTGADGFIGSHLVERLVHDGAKVRAFCLYNSQGSRGWLEAIPAASRAEVDFQFGDIRDARFVEAAVTGVEIVFHLAALVAIPYSYQAPQSFVDTNVTGTLNVLEGCRRANLACLIQTSTSEVYGTPASLPIKETHPLQAQSPYAASKIGADQLALAYHRSYGVPVTVLRPFNTYGPRQSMRAVLPTILVQLLSGRNEVRLGRLDTRRDLTFVTDTVDGFIRAAISEEARGRTIQLGTGRSHSISDLFEAACRVVGRRAHIRSDATRLRPDASEVMALEADPGLAHSLLGWRASVDLDAGLARTAEWIKPRVHLYSAESFHV